MMMQKIKEEVNEMSQEKQKYNREDANKIVFKMSSTEKYVNKELSNHIDDSPEIEPKCEIKLEEEDDCPLFQTVPFHEDKCQELSMQNDDSPEIEPKCEIKIEKGDGCPLFQTKQFHEDKSQVLLLDTSNSGHFLEETSKKDCESDRKLSTLESKIYFPSYPQTEYPTTSHGVCQQFCDDPSFLTGELGDDIVEKSLLIRLLLWQQQ
ncbi:hypothetical protein C0J52_03289 [Blattella germanica]|nr:hypothetical protein C0J52_03289 [Blattella germanica]